MKFSSVVGQANMKRHLVQMAQRGSIPHAMLFSGPEGNGALPLAMAFAQFILCDNPGNDDSCGSCSHCKKVSGIQHPDVHYSYPFFNKTGSEKTTSVDYWQSWLPQVVSNPYMGVEQWRSELTNENRQLFIPVSEAHFIIQRLSNKSFMGKYKIQIIWMAEYLNPIAANTLLKLLEEPPSGTVFLLVAVSTEQMLATILSRVQHVRVPSIAEQDMAEALSLRFPHCDGKEINHYANGDWNRALQLVNDENPNIAYLKNFQEWMRVAFKKDMFQIIKWTEAMHGKSREDQKQFLLYALDQIRQNLILNAAGQELVRMNGDESAFSEKFSRYINDHNALEFYSYLQDALNDITRNAYTKVVFADLTIRAHYLLLKGADSR